MRENRLSFLKDAFILFVITLIAGLSLGYVNELTKEPIAAREMDKKLQAYSAVYKDASYIKTDEQLELEAKDFKLTDLSNDFEGIKIDEINIAYSQVDEMLGYIIVLTSNNGYGGAIKIAIGYSIEGEMMGMEILAMNETADLGTKANDEEFKSQFHKVKAAKFDVVKGQTTNENEISAISGATVTTDAVVIGINAALVYINEFGQVVGGDN